MRKRRSKREGTIRAIAMGWVKSIVNADTSRPSRLTRGKGNSPGRRRRFPRRLACPCGDIFVGEAEHSVPVIAALIQRFPHHRVSNATSNLGNRNRPISNMLFYDVFSAVGYTVAEKGNECHKKESSEDAETTLWKLSRDEPNVQCATCGEGTRETSWMHRCHRRIISPRARTGSPVHVPPLRSEKPLLVHRYVARVINTHLGFRKIAPRALVCVHTGSLTIYGRHGESLKNKRFDAFV
ncbi:hypothetical protein ALC53_01220 [Atta colombica]|uniref:Uncharacterized protein n=1 Tax=Atta colombica TaxID=520822 RepID=A0A195BUA5_9HYME|nr:hypothetical protein ALC53_01220 [Atta colombica]